MIKHKVTKLLKFTTFAITLWILSIAYAVTSLGD